MRLRHVFSMFVLGLAATSTIACSTEAGAEEAVEADEAALSSAKNTLYLNFDGGEIDGALPPFYGEQTEPFAAAYQLTRKTAFEAYSAGFFAPALERKDVIAAVAARVQTIFAPYDLAVVTKKPAASKVYAMVMIPSKGAEQLRRNSTGLSTLYGISTIDCDNSNKMAVAFVFPEVLPLAEEPSPQKAIDAIAAVIAHEVGHTLGLKDTQNTDDVMYPYGGTAGAFGPRADIEDVNGRAFEICGSERTQDSHAMALAALGARPSP
jgi:hypothetical protein